MKINVVWQQSEEIPCIGIGQIPLCMAWALTIHKIQGATLSMAEMDLGNSVFECGQTYVALSRVKNLRGVYISALNPTKIKANPVVKEFYRNLPTQTETEKTEKTEKTETQQQIEKTEIKNVFANFAAPSDIKVVKW
jgi:ATP-dependent exoDNAse (exonuclease V) alpha subunit